MQTEWLVSNEGRKVLDDLAILISGVGFDYVMNPDNRATIVGLALQARAIDAQDEQTEALEEIGAVLIKSREHLEAMAGDLADVGRWFDKSRLWDGLK